MTLHKTAAIAVMAGMLNWGGTAFAQELPELTVKVVGNYSYFVQTKEVEAPFWNEKIVEASNGKITADYANQDILGIKDFSMLRLTKAGVADFGVSDISKMAGDDPVFEGCDLAGMTVDTETARKACDAWKPMMEEALQSKFNAHLVALGINPPIVFWCNTPIGGLSDIAGKTVRVFNTTQADFVSAVGGTTVTMAFGEVVPAMERGVVDCALTGTLTGNTSGWPEVTTHLYPLPVGWSIYYTAVNNTAWESWGPEVQEFFTVQGKELEDMNWDIGQKATEEGVNCNIGDDPCTLGKKASLQLVELSDEDLKTRDQLLQDVVLVKWGQRCGKECAQKWNETVGQVVNLTIPLDKL
jgi:TRAP-type C4-dicarboxylate transport system substrate-binding protein